MHDDYDASSVASTIVDEKKKTVEVIRIIDYVRG